MTPETRKILLDLISEYGNNQTRMAQRAVVECATTAKAFKLYSQADWRDSILATMEELEQQPALFETAYGVNTNPVEPRAG